MHDCGLEFNETQTHHSESCRQSAPETDRGHATTILILISMKRHAISSRFGYYLRQPHDIHVFTSNLSDKSLTWCSFNNRDKFVDQISDSDWEQRNRFYQAEYCFINISIGQI